MELMRIENLITTRCFRQYAWLCKLDSKFPTSYDILVMSLKIACWIWYNQNSQQGHRFLEDISKLDRYQNHMNMYPDRYAPVLREFTFFTFRNTHTLSMSDCRTKDQRFTQTCTWYIRTRAPLQEFLLHRIEWQSLWGWGGSPHP